MSAEWNPRYEAYARVHGRDPEAMLEYDRKRWPGGCMCGFMLWIGDLWRGYRKSIGLKEDQVLWGAQVERFDEMIGART